MFDVQYRILLNHFDVGVDVGIVIHIVSRHSGYVVMSFLVG